MQLAHSSRYWKTYRNSKVRFVAVAVCLHISCEPCVCGALFVSFVKAVLFENEGRGRFARRLVLAS